MSEVLTPVIDTPSLESVNPVNNTTPSVPTSVPIQVIPVIELEVLAPYSLVGFASKNGFKQATADSPGDTFHVVVKSVAATTDLTNEFADFDALYPNASVYFKRIAAKRGRKAKE